MTCNFLSVIDITVLKLALAGISDTRNLQPTTQQPRTLLQGTPRVRPRKTKARHGAGFRETRKSGLMFNGRNRFNGFTTGKPVCVLRLDSAGTEVKRKNRALKIPHKLLIIKAFLLLTEPKTAVLEGLFGRCQTALYSPNLCHLS
jgi:hypothetical protein